MPPVRNTTELPAGRPDDEGRQLGLLLDTARGLADEEFQRTARIQATGRHRLSVVTGLFAVVMAVTAGVLNALLDNGPAAPWVYPVLGGCALASTIGLFYALVWVARASRTIQTDQLDPDTLDEYVSYAERGNVGVAKNLIKAHAQILRDRRAQNKTRIRDLFFANIACGVAATASLVQIGAVFVALIASK